MSVLPSRAGEQGKRSAEIPVIFENYLKVVKLNVFTGDFHYVKTYRDSADKEACGSFYEYADRAAAAGTIHKDDAEYFRRYLDPAYLAERLSGGTDGKRIVLHGLRYLVCGRYETVNFEIIASKNFSAENPWAVICVTCPENCGSSIGSLIIPAYCKILYVRLSDGYYEPVYMTDSEISSPESLAPDISKWFTSFEAAGNVEECDRERFMRFTDMDSLRSLTAGDGEASISYSRKTCGGIQTRDYADSRT